MNPVHDAQPDWRPAPGGERRRARWRLKLASLVAVAAPLVAALAAAACSARVQRLMLRAAGGFLQAVRNHLGAVAVVALVALGLVWLAIGIGCLLERRKEAPQ